MAVSKRASVCFGFTSCLVQSEALLRKHRARGVSVALGAHGAQSEKRVVLWGTAPWLSDLPLPISPARRPESGAARV